MAEGYWANTYLSVARYSGGVSFNGDEYVIVNKDGITLFELSDPRGPHYVGDSNKAIAAGEPADLCIREWVPVYRALGREAFIEYLKEERTLKEALEYIKTHKR